MADAGIVRNRSEDCRERRKRQGISQMQDEFGSFDRYIWGFGDGRPLRNRWRGMGDVPARTAQSDAMSKDLARRGFRFVGSTICYAFMQATGMVNDHLVSCYRYVQGTSEARSHRPKRSGAAAAAGFQERAAATPHFLQSDPPDSARQGGHVCAGGGGRRLSPVPSPGGATTAPRAGRFTTLAARGGRGRPNQIEIRSCLEQRTRLEMEGVRFRGKRVDMVEHQHRFKGWDWE